MKKPLTALLLAGCMVLSLAACGGQDAAPDPAAPSAALSPSPTAGPSQEPDASPLPEQDQSVPSESSVPVSGEASPTPAEPSPTPAEASDPATPAPTAPEVQPSPEPSPEPSEDADDTTAADLYGMWALSSSQSPGPGADLTDMSAHLDAYYDLTADDLEDYVLYMPDMSASLKEVFIAKAKSGKVDAVKAACESRLAGLREDAEFYPDTGANLDTARLETQGDWVVLAVTPKADTDRLVNLLQTVAK